MAILAHVQARIVGPRLRISRLAREARGSDLAADVTRGFGRTPRTLPPKYFYDARGARLFDAICDTPEYYPTRTEQALLEAVAPEIIAEADPTHLVELGSGAARKTRTLLDALGAHVAPQAAHPTYVPIDISEHMLVSSARTLLEDYPDLRVHGVVADYDYHLHVMPRDGRRLIAFLGSTIGNFRQPRAIRFVASIAAGMDGADRLLIGFDLVKPAHVLHAAYNDAAGITAAFNLNVLEVINRELDGDFDLGGFEHVARYLPEQQQIEMYLASRRAQRVRLGKLGRSYTFSAGQLLRTEISRKFTRERAETVARAGGLEPIGWYPSSDGYFALLVAARSS
jgi:L-histidine N-alpha-methyltransferase